MKEIIKIDKKERNLYVFALMFFIVDLFTKRLILNTGNILLQNVVIEDFFSIVLSKNTGAAFSILSGRSWVFIILGILAVFLLIKYFIHNKELKKLEIISYSLLLGGILGNLCDRIVHGFVVDFLSFKIFGYYFPIFNFADIFIVIGAILLSIIIIKDGKK